MDWIINSFLTIYFRLLTFLHFFQDRQLSGWETVHLLRNPFDMIGRGATTTTYYIDKSGFSPFFQIGTGLFGSFVVFTQGIG